jgi:hypothetical protein
MTPHYSWTPASEPPDTDRFVEVWMSDGYWLRARFQHGNYYTGFSCLRDMNVTHWRDVSPPDVEPPK